MKDWDEITRPVIDQIDNEIGELLEAMEEQHKELLKESGAIDRCLQAVAAAAMEDDE